MITPRTACILKVGAGVLTLLFLAYLGIVGSALWAFREHAYTLVSAPGDLSDTATGLRLAKSALRLHGADPSQYTPGTFFGGVSVGHNTLNSNRVNTYWLPRSTNAPGFEVALELDGSNVVCYVSRSK